MPQSENPTKPGLPNGPEGSTVAGAAETLVEPVSAQAEDFGEEPSSILLSFSAEADPSDATQCVGIGLDGERVPFGGSSQGPTPATVQLELVPGGDLPSQVECPTESGRSRFDVAAADPSGGGVVTDPIDPKYLTELPFGRRSFWIQPWRAYMDTWPASRLLNAVGINFNVTAAEADGTAQLLQNSGFKLARIEIKWNQISYADPGTFEHEQELRTRLIALREHGLRPLILLNANSGGPSPAKPAPLTTSVDASAGSRTVALTPESAAKVVPGHTGFNNLSFGGYPDIFITSVNGTLASLSKPLPADLPAGEHEGRTLRYGPFGPPKLPNGASNPDFENPLHGWLEYVATVCREATEIFGAEGYDLEVWNELSFGSQFLEEGQYYSPPRVNGSGSVPQQLFADTVAYLRNPDHGISTHVGISDGFASQTPFAAPGLVPPGTTALSKHLYAGPEYFPRTATIDSNLPVDDLGAPDATTKQPPYIPKFTPSYASALPESYLTATQTETVIRDLSPSTTTIYGVPHGRNVAPVGGEAPQIWMTESNLNTNTLFPIEPDRQDHYNGPLSSAQKEQVQAEIVLRSLVAMVGKGMSREYFYAAAHSEGYSLISDAFMNALDSGESYPDESLGGDTMDALRHMLSRFQGPGPNGSARPLQLLSIAQEDDHAVFAGDGTAGHPPLYDRDLLAVLPFQSAPDRFVIPVYVMTPNLTTIARPNAPPSSLTRFDHDENFRITVGNLPASPDPPKVNAYDPLRDEATPARVVSIQGDRAVIELSVTQYPRILTLDFE